jgi:Domain of unknown function (DUF4389)
MAVPHLIVLYVLNVVLEIVGIIAWFAALFTGALPEWAHTFITGIVRWQVRVASYVFFLTDVWPPFSLDDAAYPVRLVTRPTRLNRLAVFFRFILVIPAGIVAGIATVGFVILSFFGWLITLVTGNLPPAMHQAGAAIVRYWARYTGFFYMVTSDYPSGLYGDPPIPGLAAPAPGYASASPGDDAPTPGFASEPAFGTGAPTAAPDGGWQLTLSSAAKSLVTVALVLGVIGLVGYSVGIGVAVSHSAGVSNAFALVKVEQANSELSTTIDSFPSAVNACNGQLTCVTAQDRKLGAALQTFVGTLKSITFSSSASAAATTLISDTNTAAQDLIELGGATSVSQYQSLVASGHVQQVLDNLSTDYNTLLTNLQAG